MMKSRSKFLRAVPAAVFVLAVLGLAHNDSDPIFDKSLVIATSLDGKTGRTDFVIPF
jgi:hypothetical protein